MATKLSKSIVVFLDNEPTQVREEFIKLFDITEPVNTTTQYFCITNLSRGGNRLDKYVVRTSDIHPHFYSRDCIDGAMVYGDSYFIGENFERIGISPVQVIDWGMTATEHMKIREEYLKKASNVYIGELE